MKAIFGADSTLPVTTRLKNGYDLFTWVMRLNKFPAFWGRNITGENCITPEEIDFLREKDCQIAPIYNQLTEQAVSVTDGTKDALWLVQIARGLGIPTHQEVALFAYIAPDWSVNHNWMITFAQTLASYGYVPGFIGNTDSSKNFNFDRQCSHYIQATGDVGYFGAVFWATEPKPGGEPAAWTPYCPSALEPEQVHLWQNGVTACGSISANTSYARDASVLRHMWQAPAPLF